MDGARSAVVVTAKLWWLVGWPGTDLDMNHGSSNTARSSKSKLFPCPATDNAHAACFSCH